MNFMYQKNSMQLGRSMIEMLGVLAIIGVLSVGGIAGYSKAMVKFKINKTASQVTEIATSVRTLYAQQQNCDGLTDETAMQMGIIPDEFGSSVGVGPNYHWEQDMEFSNAFGGDINVSCVKGKYQDDGSFGSSKTKDFAITFGGLTREACVSLATMDWGNSSSSGLQGMYIRTGMLCGYSEPTANGGEVYSSLYPCVANKPWFYCSKDLPLSPSSAATACNCDERGYDGCSITWYYN